MNKFDEVVEKALNKVTPVETFKSGVVACEVENGKFKLTKSRFSKPYLIVDSSELKSHLETCSSNNYPSVVVYLDGRKETSGF